MKKAIISSFLLSTVLLGMPAYALKNLEKEVEPVKNSVSSVVKEKKESDILTDEEIRSISNLADNLELSSEKLKSILSFKVKDKNCFLVPICDSNNHKDCFIRIFAKSDPGYMKYYLNGKIKTKKYVENWFLRSLANIKQRHPRSITFLIKVEDKTVGRVGMGPLCGAKGVDAEIGYALEESHSGQGIMSKAVKVALNFLQYLKSNVAQNYQFTRLRATAKPKNVASNAILKSRGFKKSKSTVNCDCGIENEYFYYFK